MASYCQRQGQDQRIVAFLLDGHHITGNQTPEQVFSDLPFWALVFCEVLWMIFADFRVGFQLERKDGDEIDAMNHHGGGGGANCGFL